MSTLEAHAIDLDAQISAVERSLSALSYKYPVLDLPNEIVAEIFVHSLPVYPECPPRTGILSPTNLSQICRKWREIALNTPLLWRAMVLPRNSDASFVQRTRETDLWLSRSGSCPLSIEIVDPYCFGTILDGWITEVFAGLNPHRARWEYLKLHLVEIPRPLTFEEPMPLLRHLDLAIEEHTAFNSFVFGDTPLLRSATLNDVAADTVILPWEQLTSLVLDRVYPRECLPVLQQTSTLIHCKLFLVHERVADLPDVTLPHLESLTLVNSIGDAVTLGYLQTLIVPALRELDVWEQSLQLSYLQGPIDSLKSFISKSGCNLQKMTISGPRFVSRDEYSRAFPSIELSFDGQYGFFDGQYGFGSSVAEG
ncbi:hypothetical protein C8F04DRAFT_455711 [Mycena alexandri]|uniref:F-box domain-containing protein n=1 Tax=Mycena alexandri TaxID=1745969 RepID=A0AAD6TGV8_9AGAR|nr:hypothetical protein C8F04DRAFT_455711 [Mycena alexandri]